MPVREFWLRGAELGYRGEGIGHSNWNGTCKIKWMLGLHKGFIGIMSGYGLALI